MALCPPVTGQNTPAVVSPAALAFWYQLLPTGKFPPLGDKDFLEVI